MILQVLPSISPRDAISQHVLRVDDELKKNNIESTIVADHIHPSFSQRVMRYNDIGSFDGHHIVYHMSIASSLADKIHSSDAKVDMWYHNITPAHYFEPWEPYVSLELRIARHQLAQMAVRVDRGVAASTYSERELRSYGCRHTRVMPVLFDPQQKSVVSSTQQQRYGRRPTQILSVGRFAPHKRVERLIYTVSLYRQLVDPEATLHLVGTSASRWYMESITQLIESLRLSDAVVFHEGISDVELARLYSRSDVYLCLSEHEGFCVPLVEAQYARLPIVALDNAAISQTINGAGVVLEPDAELVDVVGAIQCCVINDDVRRELIERAQANTSNDITTQQAREAVEWLCEGSFV